jgi:hypothetical protein
MIRIEIDGSERRLEEASERWIREEINRSLQDNGRVCVRVSFEEPQLAFTLATPDCPRSGAGKHDLTQRENEVWALWKKRGLSARDLPKGKLAGILWAFLQQVQ